MNCYCLILVFNVSVNGDFRFITIESFKHNNFCIFGNYRTVKSEGYSYFAVCCFGCECYFGTNFFSVNKECFSGWLIHKYTAYCVFFSDSQVFVGNNIVNGNITVSCEFLFTVNSCSCSEFRYFIVFNCDFDNFLVFRNCYGIVFFIRQITLGRL